MIDNLLVKNPKRTSFDSGHDGWYPYYAGYSSEFVNSLLASVNLPAGACIADPWNGSGTTTTAANKLGLQTLGYDLNPVMVLAAKACLVNRLDYTSINPISKQISSLAKSDKTDADPNDPLCLWFRSSSAVHFRKIERALQKVLVNSEAYSPVADAHYVDNISSIASFFYVALFRALNHFVEIFRPTNPTWIKVPKTEDERIAPSFTAIQNVFDDHVLAMLSSVIVDDVLVANHPLSRILMASSCAMPAANESIDLIISSPPYCTRIDYAIATMPELTLLGYDRETKLDGLRRELIGASTVPSKQPAPNPQWGATCNNFLEAIYGHESKASKSYYYKNHVQYFNSVFQSVVEIARVLKANGGCVLVVQDSHYKNVYNNLPLIFSEMGSHVGLELIKAEQFVSTRNMAARNPEVRKYRSNASATESVLCFKKYTS